MGNVMASSSGPLVPLMPPPPPIVPNVSPSPDEKALVVTQSNEIDSNPGSMEELHRKCKGLNRLIVLIPD